MCHPYPILVQMVHKNMTFPSDHIPSYMAKFPNVDNWRMYTLQLQLPATESCENCIQSSKILLPELYNKVILAVITLWSCLEGLTLKMTTEEESELLQHNAPPPNPQNGPEG